MLIHQTPRYLLEAVLVIFVVLLVLLTLRSDSAAGRACWEPLACLVVAAIRLMPMASQLAAALTNLRFQRDAVSRLWYADVQQLSNLAINRPTATQCSDSRFSEAATEECWLSLSEHKARRTA